MRGIALHGPGAGHNQLGGIEDAGSLIARVPRPADVADQRQQDDGENGLQGAAAAGLCKFGFLFADTRLKVAAEFVEQVNLFFLDVLPGASVGCDLVLHFDGSEEGIVQLALDTLGRGARAFGGQEIQRRAAQVDGRAANIDLAQRRLVGGEGFVGKFVDGSQNAAHRLLAVIGGGLGPVGHKFSGSAPDQIELFDIEILGAGQCQFANRASRRPALQPQHHRVLLKPAVHLLGQIFDRAGDVGLHQAARDRIERFDHFVLAVSKFRLDGGDHQRRHGGRQFSVLGNFSLTQRLIEDASDVRCKTFAGADAIENLREFLFNFFTPARVDFGDGIDPAREIHQLLGFAIEQQLFQPLDALRHGSPPARRANR